MSKNTRNRILLTAVAALLLVVMAVGGTLAYLTDVTPVVSNTFTPADVHISLTETPNQNDGTWTAQLIPGKEYMKDPIVTVDDALTNVDLWVFVKVEDTNAAAYLDYSVRTGTAANEWKVLDATNHPGVYYLEWDDNAATDSWYVLTAGTDTNAEGAIINPNGAVTVKEDLTADDLYNATASLKFTAYAIQKEGFATASAAWAEVSQITAATADNNLDDDTAGQAHLAETDPDHSGYEIE